MRRLGIALGGGGSKGSYQLGVLKALLEEDLLSNLKVISGTSIGALNACLVMGRKSFDEMFNIWNDIDNSILYKLSNNRITNDKLGLFDQKTMYDILIEKQDPLEIIKSDIEGYVTLTKIKEYGLRKQLNHDLMEGEIININKVEDPHKYALASASVPIIFGPTEINGEYYVDGGLFNNLPVDVLIEQKCDAIIVIGLNPNNDLKEYNESLDKLIINFSPPHKLVNSPLGMLDFRHKPMEKRIETGYENAKEIIKFLKDNKIISGNKWNNQVNGIYELDINGTVIKL